MPPLALTRAKARHSALPLAAIACAARLGVAAADPLPVASASLELDADAGCATREDLVARVRARSPRVRFVDAGSGLAIRVLMATTQAGAVTSEITLANPGTKPSIRHVSARSCVEAADAVALIIAVTLDPTSIDARADSDATKRDAPTTTAGNRTASNGRAAAAAATAPKPESPAPSSESAPGSETSALTPSRAGTSFGLQLAAEAFFGVAPAVMPGVGMYGVASFERPSLWSPAAMLGVRHAWRHELEEPGGSASFTLDAATFDACPLRFRWRAIEARPCGSLLFGRLSARGSQTFNPAAESVRPFWVLGGAAIVTADLPARLLLSARLAMGANLVRDSFEFTPALFHEVPPVSAAVGVGIGMRWQ